MATGVAIGWQVENSNGVPVSGAKIYTYRRSTVTAQSAYTDSAITVPAANPIIADAAGWWNAYLNPANDYTVVIKSADDSITYQTRDYFATSTTAAGGGNTYTVADTKAELSALEGDDSEDTVIVLGRTAAGDGGGGTFRWVTGDQSANITADPGAGIWVPPDSDATGASGAWQRLHKAGALEAAWWGVVADATVTAYAWTGTDNTTALNYATAYLRRKLVTESTEGSHSLSLPPGNILVTTANFTGLRGSNAAIYGNGAILGSKTAGKVVADFLHSWKLSVYDLGFAGDVNTPPRRAVQQGYISTAATSASLIKFVNCSSVGYFTDTALYNGGAEETSYESGQWENRYASCTASIILDAYNEDGRFSDYQTGDLIAQTPTAITQANPGVVTIANHGYSNGDIVKFAEVGGMTQLNGNTYTVANATTNTFELSGTDTSGFSAFTSGGYCWQVAAYSFVNVLMKNASAFSQLGGDGMVIRGGVQNVTFDGYLYSLDAAGCVIYTRNAVDTRRPNYLHLNAVVEGTSLVSCIEFVRGGSEVVPTGWNIILNGIQPQTQIFLDDNTSNGLYFIDSFFHVGVLSTSPTNGVCYPASKFRGGEWFIRAFSGLTNAPTAPLRLEVQDPYNWALPAGSYDVLANKSNTSNIDYRMFKGEQRFYGTGSTTYSANGFPASSYTSINGNRVLSPFIGTEVSFTMADDSAKTIDLPGSTPAVLIALACNSGSFANGLYWTRASGSPASVALTSGGTPATLSTGIKTGTTGTDGLFHFSPHTDGNLYLENRSGASLTVSYTILSAV